MHIQQDFSLRHLNTFWLESRARYYVEAGSVDDLTEILLDPKWLQTPKFILGGGSNILLTRDVDALVIYPKLMGIENVYEDETRVSVRAQSGVVWHDFVLYCVSRNYGGVENLALIPGTTGAAPMQNIGAYGVEIKDVIGSVDAVSIKTGEKRTFTNAECQFGYRESIFKKELKGQYIITAATFILDKYPVLNVTYGDIQKTLQEMQVAEVTIQSVSEAVMQIRRSKLPDPAKIGNAGSFFKNPEISAGQYDDLKNRFPDLPGYPVGNERVKVPAGWLIERTGWKGFREGSIGVHDRQALVLVNYGGGTGDQIRALSERIQDSVVASYGIQLAAEVNFV